MVMLMPLAIEYEVSGNDIIVSFIPDVTRHTGVGGLQGFRITEDHGISGWF